MLMPEVGGGWLDWFQVVEPVLEADGLQQKITGGVITVNREQENKATGHTQTIEDHINVP